MHLSGGSRTTKMRLCLIYLLDQLRYLDGASPASTMRKTRKPRTQQTKTSGETLCRQAGPLKRLPPPAPRLRPFPPWPLWKRGVSILT